MGLACKSLALELMDSQEIEKNVSWLNYQIFRSQRCRMKLLESELSLLKGQNTDLTASLLKVIENDIHRSQKHAEMEFKLAESRGKNAALIHRLQSIYVSTANAKARPLKTEELPLIDSILSDLADVMHLDQVRDQALRADKVHSIKKESVDWSESTSNVSQHFLSEAR